MTKKLTLEPTPIRATALLHQEGILAAVALTGLFFRGQAPLSALLPRTPWLESLGAGIITGGVSLLLLAGLLLAPAVRDLERWQAGMVQGWTLSDTVAVSVFSGLAEEALIRALLQPWIGLFAASGIFAVMHIVPDRRLWAWPVIAMGLGLIFGLVFEHWGYPAVAIAHIVVNLASFLRLRQKTRAISAPNDDSHPKG